MNKAFQGILAAGLALLAYAGGALETLELGLLEARYSLFEREASGELVAVQIDAQSLRELGTWPLPRNNYAFAVRALHAAGAQEIAIDVDMSARLEAGGTAALASALADTGGHVILPAFTQLAMPGNYEAGLVDAIPETELAENAWLGSVNVIPDSDGQLRKLSFGMPDAEGRFRYSMFSLLAGRTRANQQPFYVDYGIDVRSIPRISFVDVLKGAFEIEDVNGKRVIIGGTAVELGDHFSVPRYGVMSGPMVQAMGFETLYQEREIYRTGPVAIVMLVIIVTLIAVYAGSLRGWRPKALLALAGIIVLLAISLAFHRAAAISVDTVPAMLALLIVAAAQVTAFADAQQRQAQSQRRKTAHQRIILDRVISDSSDGVIVINAEGGIEISNARARELCGLPRDGVHSRMRDYFAGLTFAGQHHGRHWHDLPPGEPVLASVEHDEDCRHLELIYSRSEVPDLQSGLDVNSTREVFGVTIRDVTDRVRAAEAMEKAREQAEKASRAKTDFLANMSHELRTPLNAIIGFSQMMLAESAGPLGNRDYVEYVGHIKDGGDHLLAIINDVLDVSRIEMGEIECADEEIDVTEFIDAAITIARGAPVVAACRIENDFGRNMPEIRADGRRIQQAVMNLVSNAAKFSEAGSTIRIRCGLEDGCAFIEVADEGCGIPEEHLEAILTPFQQVNASMNRSGEGTGLGLTIVAALMKLHGGGLNIDSTVGVGTTVRLTFPAERTVHREGRAEELSAGVA